MDITDTLKHLKTFAHAEEAYQVTIFHVTRHSPTNGRQEVTVEILDRGESDEDIRYACQAHTTDGKFATPSSAPTIDQAIALTHWHKLDE